MQASPKSAPNSVQPTGKERFRKHRDDLKCAVRERWWYGQGFAGKVKSDILVDFIPFPGGLKNQAYCESKINGLIFKTHSKL